MATGAEATYYNPALLPRAGAQTEVGAYFLVTRGDIHLDPRPDNVDVPVSIYDARLRNPDGSSSRLELRPFPTTEIPEPREDTLVRSTSSYATLGVAFPLLNEKLVFGFYGLLPIRNVQRQSSFFSDEREQYFDNRLEFELLGDRFEISSFAIALGSQVTRWLALGAGVDLTIRNTAVTGVYVPDASDQRRIFLNPDIRVETAISPYFGIATQPTPELGLAATVHFPIRSDTDGINEVRFFNFEYPDDEDAVVQTFKSTQGYEPLRASTGASYKSLDEKGQTEWGLGSHVLLERWTTYRDRHGEAPLDGWRNTFSVAVGGVVGFKPGSLALDAEYKPSPVPDQTGRTNYVDNARILTSAGFETPVKVFGLGFRFGVYLHGQYLVPRSVEKDPNAVHPVLDEFPDGSTDLVNDEVITESTGLQTNNPGYPGYSSEGFIMGVGVAFKFPAIRRER